MGGSLLTGGGGGPDLVVAFREKEGGWSPLAGGGGGTDLVPVRGAPRDVGGPVDRPGGGGGPPLL